MRSRRIYTAQALDSNAVFNLEPEPSRHLARALRMRAGDSLTLFNGRGGEYPAELIDVSNRNVQVRTGACMARDCDSNLDIQLGIAVSRGERMDWIVQKATELGVNSVTPLATEHAGVKLSVERADKKIRHWTQVAISACEQCGRNKLPEIHPMQELVSWLAATLAERKFVLHHRATMAAETGDSPASVALLVGPEGGLSSAEIETAERAGYAALSLGPRVLRTETAPLAAIAILQSRWGDMPFA
jgi:16S rRNA (uracil1498-N3)-methyltransferase